MVPSYETHAFKIAASILFIIAWPQLYAIFKFGLDSQRSVSLAKMAPFEALELMPVD